MTNFPECSYEYDPECDWGVDLVGCCTTCICEKNRTCPTEIYFDTVITFPPKRGE